MKRIVRTVLLASALAMGPMAATADTADGEALNGMAWDEIVEMAKGGEVNWFLWGGSDNINQYVSEYIGGILKENYDITLNRVGLSDTVEAVNIVLSEKEAGVLDKGTVDMICATFINGPFRPPSACFSSSACLPLSRDRPR